MKLRTALIITLASVFGAGIASAQQQGTSPKPASKATKAAQSRDAAIPQLQWFHRQARHADDQERAGATGVGPRIVQGLHHFGETSGAGCERHHDEKTIAMQNLASGK